MFRKVLSIISLVTSGFFLSGLFGIAFIQTPYIGVKILMMGISSIPMLLTLFLGLSLRSFTQWQKICGIIFISTAIYFAFAFLSIVCMLYTPDLKSVVDQKALALFSDIASGAAFFSLVLLSGIVLLYKGNSTKTSSIYFKTGNSQTFSNSDATRDKENLQQKISDPDYNFSRNSPSNNPGQTKDPMVMQLAFSKEKMADINQKGYELYQQAQAQQDPELYFEAGENYDRSYDSIWGDNIFAGRSWREVINNFGLPPEMVGETGVQKLIQTAQESLVVSCECYIMALSIAPDHFMANLHLATALTAGLQVRAALPYWAKSLDLNYSDALRALVADSDGLFNKGEATKAVTELLGLGQLSYASLMALPDVRFYGELATFLDDRLEKLKYSFLKGSLKTTIGCYREQQALASKMLRQSPLLCDKIKYLSGHLD